MPANALDHLALFTDTLRTIANGRDCDYADFPAEKPDPCTCPPCAARAALAAGNEWRYRGAHHPRVTSGFNPRETAIVKAWADQVDDRKLAGMLTELAPDDRQRAFVVHEMLQPPTARDWFVATSVVQWLVTNVGTGVLEAAGWKYTRYEADRAAREAAQRRGQRTIPGKVIRFDENTWWGVVAADDPAEGEIEFHGTCSQVSGRHAVGTNVMVVFNRDGALLAVRRPAPTDDAPLTPTAA